MRALLVGTCLLLAAASAGARPKAKKAPAPAQASAQTTRAIEELMGRFKWGMSRKDVAAAIEENVRAEFEEKIREAADAWDQQKLRDEMMARIREFQASAFEFIGKKSGWDVSLIDTEFGHMNDEAMLVTWERDQRRFFFFHKGRLYKMFVALAADRFKGKSFEDFGQMIQDRYGPAEARYSPNRAGRAVFDRLVWPAAGATELQAVDRSFYGNFCLNLMDTAAAARVAEGREVNSPKASKGDPAVLEALTEGRATTKDANEDVVDQITKRRAQGAKEGGSDEGMVDPDAPPPAAGAAAGTPVQASPAKKDEKKKEDAKPAEPPPAKKKKVNSDPLEGVDL